MPAASKEQGQATPEGEKVEGTRKSTECRGTLPILGTNHEEWECLWQQEALPPRGRRVCVACTAYAHKAGGKKMGE
eukprot:684843-Amphidinium_carterae.1